DEVARGEALAYQPPFHVDQGEHDGVDGAGGDQPLEGLQRPAGRRRAVGADRSGRNRIHVRHRRSTSSTILPFTPPFSSRSCAAAASSSGNTLSMVTSRSPESTSSAIFSSACPSGSTSGSATLSRRF